LPLLLTAYVFHARSWNKNSAENSLTNELEMNSAIDNNENRSSIGEMILNTKEKMKSACVHEILVQKTNNEAAPLCPKLSTEKVAFR
jgi:hypothetical protein